MPSPAMCAPNHVFIIDFVKESIQNFIVWVCVSSSSFWEVLCVQRHTWSDSDRYVCEITPPDEPGWSCQLSYACFKD